MNRCLIVTGGTLETDFLKEYLKGQEFSLITAVDGALAFMQELGLAPTHVVGDFDTVKPDVLSFYEANPSVVLKRHRPEKDETDTELALSYMLEAGAEDITIVGAVGSRMDHTYANIGLLYQALQAKVPCRILDSRNRITLIEKEAHFRKDSLYGKYVSFYPLTGEAEGLCLRGFAYPLENYHVTYQKNLCISNELSEEEGFLTLKKGILICFETKD